MSQFVLEVVEGPEAGRQIPLDSFVEIGRDAGLVVALPQDKQASRRHARVTLQGGRAVVEDLGSTNGTFVNDQRIHTPRTLAPGDRIRVGYTVLELRDPAGLRERASAVQPRPHIAAVGAGVLLPVQDPGQLAQVPPPAPPPLAAPPPAAAAPPPAPPPPAPPPAGPVAPSMRVAETPAGYVPREAVADLQAEPAAASISGLADTSVKQRRNVGMFAILATSALSVIVYYGLT